MLKVFNISSSNCFVEVLASKLLDEYQANQLDLADVLILLPNRRACRSLAEAFVRLKGMNPTLLPQMKAIGDVDDDELMLTGDGAEDAFLALPPVIEPLERRMLFMRLIISRYAEFGLEKISLAQACYLAQELGNLIDKAAMQGLNWDKLETLVPEEYAAHWQETLKFLKIITAYWPDILAERGVVDAGKRKNILIEKQSRIWQQQQPRQRIIVAGTTAVSPAMKELVKTVASLPNGEVYLAGLDCLLEDEAWEEVDETHPQFELKQLLDYLQIERREVHNVVPPARLEREKFISEVMRPATTSENWLNLKGKLDKTAVEGIKLIEADDQRIEAIVIAILIRQALETPEKTIALITPDRYLARRVAGELRRWQITVDDSAGVPLMQTPWGIFMRLVVAAAMPEANRERILALLKSKLFGLAMAKKDVHLVVSKLDKVLWRQNEAEASAENLLEELKTVFAPLTVLLRAGHASLKEIITAHAVVAEKLAQDDKTEGKKLLWQGDDGEVGAAFVAGWLDKADVLGEIDTADYLSLFEVMAAGVMVRRKRPSHPRVRILGPMEARLNHFDEIILGGLNEGVWPAAAVSDPWMSRPMKHEFGFEAPEKSIGVLGLDFANLLGASKVWLTRAKMNEGTPTIKSRWGMRLETVLQALDIDVKSLSDAQCLYWAEKLDEPRNFVKIEPPAPKPPVTARPRRLSASAFEKLLRDPYGVFAEYILQLKPLDELEPEASMADFGNVVHKVLEEFGRQYPTVYPPNAKQILADLGQKAFEQSGFPEEKQAFWRPKFAKMVDWICVNEEEYRRTIARIYNEIWGNYFIEDAPGGRFEIYAKADRIDQTIDGKLNIIDYKTGKARKAKEVKTGYAPQLPIEGLIAINGGFEGIDKADVESLMYWKLGDKEVKVDEDIATILENTRQHICKVVNLFDFETTGYLSRPNPQNVPEYSDYEHLARVKEWSVKGEDDGD